MIFHKLIYEIDNLNGFLIINLNGFLIIIKNYDYIYTVYNKSPMLVLEEANSLYIGFEKTLLFVELA